MSTFTGKTAFITGGATGIGAAIVERFASLGASVVCCYHKSRSSAEELADKLRGQAVEIFLVQADVAQPQAVKAAVEASIAHFGRPISILINNAGDSVSPASVDAMDESLWQQVIDINLTGPFLCAKYCIAGMKQLGSGRIINISSISARSGGGPGSVHYVSSKAGLEGFTRALAKELGPFHITVNGIAPGLVDTALLRRMNTPERLEQLRQTVPLLRIGDAADVARVVSFVASDDGRYITGEIIAVNGGMRMD
jgi:3-oxoacyl-[acyl-carrier protein] reductase